MTREQIERLVAMLGLLTLCGCGGGAGQGEGIVAVQVKNAQSFNPKAEHGRIEGYEVSIDGEGIPSPMIAFFPGDAEEGIIEDVPVGKDRTVSVKAINPNGALIRAGETTGVVVTEDPTAVEVEMQAVPIFTNIADGSVIDNTRIVFRVFSDPGNPVIVEGYAGEQSFPLVDASANSPEIFLDESTGLGRLSPSIMEPGDHRFVVRDTVTGRSSEAGVKLLDGSKRKPAPLFSAGLRGSRLR